MQSKGTPGSGARSRLGSTSLVQRLLDCVKPAAMPPPGEAADSGFDELQPAGRRSGRGAASLAPYLDQFRSTRPASLD